MMKHALTALITTLLSLPLMAGELDLSQTEADIKLIGTYFKPSSSDQTLRNVDTLTRQTVQSLAKLEEGDGQRTARAQELWSRLEAALNQKLDHTTESRLSVDNYEEKEAIREQVDTKAATINRFYQEALRDNPTLGGAITLQLHFLQSGYLSDIEIKEADKDMTLLAERIMPTLRTVRIKAQSAQKAINYKLHFFPDRP